MFGIANHGAFVAAPTLIQPRQPVRQVLDTTGSMVERDGPFLIGFGVRHALSK